MSDYLHPDLLTNILARLSIKTLLRCTLVCQSWYSLIKSHDFAIAHFNWRKPEGLFLLRSHTVQSGEEIYALHWDNERLSKYVDFDVTFRPAYNDYHRIIGSCNGVFCLSDDMYFHRKKVVLWNPAIRKWLRLPHRENSLRSRAFKRVTGFGYDSNSKDFKVVRIINYHDVDVPAEVSVYSLSSETWRNVSHLESKLHFLGPSAPQAFINGALHWIVSDNQAKKNYIVSFNLSIEAFHTLELPGTVPYIALSSFPVNLILKLAVIEGLLALVKVDERCCIWLMKDYGVCSSWTKKVDFEFNGEVERFIGVRNNGELLIEKRGDLYSYDPRCPEAGQQCLYTSFDTSSFLSTRTPHFPGQTGRKRLKISSLHDDYQYPVDQLALYIEAYQESFVLLGMQSVVGEYEMDSEDEEGTDSGEEETESSEEETESENEEEEEEPEYENEVGQTPQT